VNPFHNIRSGKTNCFVLIGEDALALIDPGPPGKGQYILDTLESLESFPNKLGLIIVTHAHRDHIGCAADISRLTGAPIAMHEADVEAAARGKADTPRGNGFIGKMLGPLFRLKVSLAAFEPVKPDLLLEDGQSLARFGIDASVYHTPGHTPGSLTVVARRHAFVGDLVLTRNESARRPLAWSPNHWRRSIERLRRLGLETIHPAHGSPFPAERLSAEPPPSCSHW